LDFDGRINDLAYDYNPLHPVDFQDCYVEVVVEKVDLVGLFRPICRKHYVPISNFKGWTDLNSRVDLIQRFRFWYDRGKQCVILYCGDHDPGGLKISESLTQNLMDMEDAAGCPAHFINIDRFGLNYDFIEENRLSWIDNLETSGRDSKTGKALRL